MIVAAFLGGVFIVPVAVILENIYTSELLFTLVTRAQDTFGSSSHFFQTTESFALLLALLPAVIIEEGLKLAAFLVIAYPSRYVDEPVDAIIYLISVALGFAAFENVLFFLNGIGSTDYVTVHNVFLSAEVPRAFLVNNLRFIGANLLHLVASGFIGVFLGLAFYKNTVSKIFYILNGFLGAVLLHLMFNYFIIILKNNPIIVFAAVWVFSVLLIVLFERVKQVRKRILYT
jgi:RsiW-degrading membrane proteinase PrsW (M82 family)